MDFDRSVAFSSVTELFYSPLAKKFTRVVVRKTLVAASLVFTAYLVVGFAVESLFSESVAGWLTVIFSSVTGAVLVSYVSNIKNRRHDRERLLVDLAHKSITGHYPNRPPVSVNNMVNIIMQNADKAPAGLVHWPLVYRECQFTQSSGHVALRLAHSHPGTLKELSSMAQAATE